ncbi:VOC family protein [Streptomyces sp. FIT100]|uniref:VOC family protein n=1 Tax=Streptomyces sp. FIT100 TaxID=2837956 RepID=UPI0021C8600C|nr:VOC family protein [Streptomyces sp. FIT100]UUN31606.1 VOC family protein [Streptomyces sp. FIT100]
MARDLQAAQDFYGRVFGWEFRPTRLGEEFSVALLDGIPVAGIGALARSLAVPVAWTPYFAVDDADVTAARIRERSATVAVGPITFGTGRGALAADRDGAVFGIWQGLTIPDWCVGRDKAPAWLELRTRDAFDAAIFYAEVLDWACERPDCCQVTYEHDRIVLRHGGDALAQITGGAVEAAPDPQIRPRWHVHFYVPDIDYAVRAATKLGGSAVTAAGSADTTTVTLRDPDGGLFTVAARPPGDPAPAH